MGEIERAALVKAVGRAIAAKRVENKLSQENVAERLGISREAVSRMETGVAIPSVLRLAELAEIFGCAIEDLLTAASNRKLDQARHITELLDDLSQEKRDVLLNVIKQLIVGFSSKS
jgi:transcriptional regulator with XRE-family HTH domain